MRFRAKHFCILAVIAVCAVVFCAVEIKRIHANNPAVWTVTQYASAENSQIMFYTIEDNKGRFAIVDGGLQSDTEQVWNAIRRHKRHVDAWIITHPHPDHTDAFNRLMQDPPGEFTVDTIYLPEVNPDAYEEKQKSYDVISSYYEQTEVTKDLDNVIYVHENDQFDLIGLEMKVISSWDANVDALPDHLPNNGSIMFRISGNEQSMLFCADVQKEMEPYILPEHEEDLKADYVQCGHHGNWGLNKEFYDHVGASVAFMDSPEWLFDPDSDYTAADLKEYLENKGMTVYTFETAPNQVVIH